MVHGTGDRVLSPICSETLYELAHEPRRLVLYPGAGHVLDEAAEDVHLLVSEWLLAELGAVEG